MRTIAVVGASLAGLSAARALRTQGYTGQIVLIGAETHLPYDRPPLSKQFLLGTADLAQLQLLTPADEALELSWRLGSPAVRLDRSAGAVLLADGSAVPADGVVLTTGARARPLPGAAGAGLAGVHTLRTLDDAVALRAALRPGIRLIVIGAGFIGAEVASAARQLGAEVTAVETAELPFAGVLGPAMARVCAGLAGDRGVRLLTGVGVSQVLDTGGSRRRRGAGRRVSGVRLADGRTLPADLVVVGIGAVANVEWLAGSGLELAGGVVTDARCATAVPAVVAAGDCAVSRDVHTGQLSRLEHWTHAQEQPATAVATLLAGQRTPAPPEYTAVPYFWSDQYGVRIQFAGHVRAGDAVQVIDGDPDTRNFLAVYERAGSTVGVLAMNQSRLFARWRRRLARPVAG